MKQRLLFVLLLTFFCIPLASFAQSFMNLDKVSLDLQTEMDEHRGRKYQVSILLSDYVDVYAMDQQFYARNASLQERTFEVITTLKAKAAATQPAVLDYLAGRSDVSQESIKAFWITNLICAEVPEQVVADLSNLAQIDFIDLQPSIELDPYTVDHAVSPKDSRSVNGHEPGHDAIKAPIMWEMGYTGYGRIAYGIDTGVDPNHPALQQNWLGNFVPGDQAWFEGGGGSIPSDCDNHGTHTMGTILGLDRDNNDTIGVAFNALWMAAPAITCPNGPGTIASFQYALDPDNNPNTTDDMPDVINNSWRNGTNNQCSATNQFKLMFDALEAAGIAVVFSAGNDGVDNQGMVQTSSVTPPKNINTNLVNVFAVASVNGNVNFPYPLSSFSSRGPSICGGTGSLLIKPEVAAPGSSVRSCVPGTGYANLSGTSMAAPHVSGAVLILKEAFPALTGVEIKLALYNTCVDLGDPGEDNNFGMGIIDIPAAFQYLILQGNTPQVPNTDYDVAANSLVNIPTEVCANSVAPVFVMGNIGDQTITSATITYTYSDGTNDITNSIPWTGTLPPTGQQPVVLPVQTLTPGSYTLTVEVELPAANNEYFVINNSNFFQFSVLPPSIETTGATICENSEGVIVADIPQGSTGNVFWYSSMTGGTPVGAGTPFITPPLSTATTYYADLITDGETGEPDNTTGTGGNHQFDSQYLIFDAISAFTLKEVTVYSNQIGTRNIQLRASNGAIISSVNANIGFGQQTVQLGFEIPPGTDYQLGISGLSEMYRHQSGTSYPYIVPGVLNIRTSSAGNNFYYYFYDWQISYGSPCGRSETAVDVIPGSLTAAFTPSQSSIQALAPLSFTDNTTGAVSWSWDFGDGNTSTMQNPTHTYDSMGTYLVTLVATNADGCSDVTTMPIEVTFAVDIEDDLNAIGAVTLFPNPSQGLVTLGINLPQQTEGLVKVYDVLGKEIAMPYTGTLGTNTIKMDLSGHKAGIYYIKIEAKGQSAVKKLILSN